MPHIYDVLNTREQNEDTYKEIGCFEGRTVHVVYTIFFENTGEAIDQPVFI